MYGGFTDGSVVKESPAMHETQETWVQSLDWEDPLEKEMVTHSSILAWRIPWKEEPGRLQSKGLQRVGNGWATEHYTLVCKYQPGKKNQYFSLKKKILDDLYYRELLPFIIWKNLKNLKKS